MCVYNLINGSFLVESSGINFGLCGDYELNTGAAGETTTVTWSYTESACQRTGKYELQFLGKFLFKSTFENGARQFNLII